MERHYKHLNADRGFVTFAPLTVFGREPQGAGLTHGSMTLVAAPVYTSSYLTPPAGPIPDPIPDVEWNGGFDPLALPDIPTTLGLDLSGSGGKQHRRHLCRQRMGDYRRGVDRRS